MPNEINHAEVARRIELLKRLELAAKTQVDLAEAFEISLSYYQCLEQGRKNPSERVLKNIADYYNEPVFSFTCTEVNEPKPGNEVSQIVLQPSETFTPTAVKGVSLRMSNGSICTTAICPWRLRVDDNTYYCPPGCMKERCACEKKRA